MPIFKPKGDAKPKGETKSKGDKRDSVKSDGAEPTSPDNGTKPTSSVPSSAPKLVFHVQQAQGSPTGLISGFANVRQLYQKIAECYDFPQDEILFCTLNTHKVDMTKLLGGQIGIDDFIFVHRKGQAKEIELRKSEDALGLTITDNGAGYAFIKRIKEGSVIDALNVIQVGDHIEKINEMNLVGRRHFEVAKMLKDIPRDAVFTLRLVEPFKGFEGVNFGKPDRKEKKKDLSRIDKMQTIRFSPLGAPVIQEAPGEVMVRGIEKINILLDSFLGINDNELATRIWEQAEGKTNSMEFADAIDNSDLEEFGFTDDFIIELWGAVTDARSGRLK